MTLGLRTILCMGLAVGVAQCRPAAGTCDKPSCPNTREPTKTSSLLQQEATLDRKATLIAVGGRASSKRVSWGNPIKIVEDVADGVRDVGDDIGDTIKDVGDGIGDAVKDVAKEAEDIANDVIDDIEDATEAAIDDLHNAIVKGFNGLKNFLVTHIEKAWKMLDNIFSCLMDIVAETLGECAQTWAKQTKACIEGRGCAISIGMPTCKSVGTKDIFSVGFLELNNESIQADDEVQWLEAEGVAEDVGEPVNGTILRTERIIKDQVSVEIEELEKHLDKTGISVEDPGEDATENSKLLEEFSESSRALDVEWKNPVSAVQANSSTETGSALSSSGRATLGMGCLLNVNVDSGLVSLKTKMAFDVNAKFAGSNIGGTRYKDYAKKYITNHKTILTKVIMAGKVPVKVSVSVALVHQAGAQLTGDFNFEALLRQRLELNLEVNFNTKRMDRGPSWTGRWSWWDPNNSPVWSGSGKLSFWYQVAPEVKVEVQGVPLKKVWGPKWIASAEIQRNSQGCTKTTFSVDTTLAGDFTVGVPALPMGDLVGNSCHLFANILTENRAVQAASCVTKAAFNFDPAEAARDACDVIKNNLPNWVGKSWTMSLGQRRLGYKQLGGNHLCQKDCVPVTMVNKMYGHENSWTIGSCNGRGYRTWQTADAGLCCLDSGRHTLECKDSYGDGWHGGHLVIDGSKYCHDFSGGKNKKVIVVI